MAWYDNVDEEQLVLGALAGPTEEELRAARGQGFLASGLGILSGNRMGNPYLHAGAGLGVYQSALKDARAQRKADLADALAAKKLTQERINAKTYGDVLTEGETPDYLKLARTAATAGDMGTVTQALKMHEATQESRKPIVAGKHIYDPRKGWMKNPYVDEGIGAKPTDAKKRMDELIEQGYTPDQAEGIAYGTMHQRLLPDGTSVIEDYRKYATGEGSFNLPGRRVGPPVQAPSPPGLNPEARGGTTAGVGDTVPSRPAPAAATTLRPLPGAGTYSVAEDITDPSILQQIQANAARDGNFTRVPPPPRPMAPPVQPMAPAPGAPPTAPGQASRFQNVPLPAGAVPGSVVLGRKPPKEMDEAVQTLGKAYTGTGIEDMERIMSELKGNLEPYTEVKDGKLVKKAGIGDIPGMGLTGGGLPSTLLTTPGGKISRTLQELQNIRLYDLSGKAVTANELARQLRASGNTMLGKDEAVIDWINRVENLYAGHKANVLSAANPEVLDEYLKRRQAVTNKDEMKFTGYVDEMGYEYTGPDGQPTGRRFVKRGDKYVRTK